jgi:hypothetical protein
MRRGGSGRRRNLSPSKSLLRTSSSLGLATDIHISTGLDIDGIAARSNALCRALVFLCWLWFLEVGLSPGPDYRRDNCRPKAPKNQLPILRYEVHN